MNCQNVLRHTACVFMCVCLLACRDDLMKGIVAGVGASVCDLRSGVAKNAILCANCLFKHCPRSVTKHAQAKYSTLGVN